MPPNVISVFRTAGCWLRKQFDTFYGFLEHRKGREGKSKMACHLSTVDWPTAGRPRVNTALGGDIAYPHVQTLGRYHVEIYYRGI